jgi:hypothetical protein
VPRSAQKRSNNFRVFSLKNKLFSEIDKDSYENIAFWVNARFKTYTGLEPYMTSDCTDSMCNYKAKYLDDTWFVYQSYMDLDLTKEKKCIQIKENDDIRAEDCDKDGGRKLVCLLDCCK